MEPTVVVVVVVVVYDDLFITLNSKHGYLNFSSFMTSLKRGNFYNYFCYFSNHQKIKKYIYSSSNEVHTQKKPN